MSSAPALPNYFGSADDAPDAPPAHADLAFYFGLEQEAEVKVLIDLVHPERPGHPFAALRKGYFAGDKPLYRHLGLVRRDD